jgi:hypothetical protein
MSALTLPDAWMRLRQLLKSMGALFGEPAQIAAFGFIANTLRADILAWLAPIERMARLILLAQAADLRVAVARRVWRPRREGKTRPRAAFDVSAADSAAWRVSFRALPPGAPASSRASRGGVRVHDARPLAARFEALIRVVLDPAPVARRVALRLSRRGLDRKRARRLLRMPRRDAPPLVRAIAPIRDLAYPALACFGDTS